MQKILLSLALVLFSGSIFANNTTGLRHTIYYIGFNSGASIAHFQGFDQYFDTGEAPPPPPPYESCHQNDVSASGYNGGMFLGYNFYCCNDLLLGLEISGGLYSNRGYYTINYYNNANGSTSGFEFSFDVDFSVHATFRPQYLLTDRTLVFAQIGAGYADINVRAKNLVGANIGTHTNPVNNRQNAWGLTLGLGIQHRVSCHTNVFAAYEYTSYRSIDLSDVAQEAHGAPQIGGAFENRSASVDTNVFKMGLIFTF